METRKIRIVLPTSQHRGIINLEQFTEDIVEKFVIGVTLCSIVEKHGSKVLQFGNEEILFIPKHATVTGKERLNDAKALKLVHELLEFSQFMCVNMSLLVQKQEYATIGVELETAILAHKPFDEGLLN